MCLLKVCLFGGSLMAFGRNIAHWLHRIRSQTILETRMLREFAGRIRKKTQPDSSGSNPTSKAPRQSCPINKCWKKPALLVAVWVVLLVSSLSVMSFAVTPFLKVLQSPHALSLGWSGYVVTSDVLLEQPVVIGVNGSWTVPSVAASTVNKYSSVWIGIGGHTDQTLIQCGTEHDSVNGQTHYSVWYELLPEYSIPIQEITVQPGDNITAAISLVDSDLNQWLIEIKNLSNKQSWSRTFVYNSSRLSAEWVVERPQLKEELTELADFGSVTFTGVWAKLKETQGTMTSFPSNTITMSNHQNAELTEVSPISSDGSSFTVTYIGR